MTDILKMLKDKGFEPEVILDDNGFGMLTGKYVTRVDSCGRITGVSKTTNEPYDFRSLSLQITGIVDGDKAMNRFLKRTYNPDEAGLSKMLNELFTAGITISATTDEELDLELEGLKDKTINVRCWPWKNRKGKDGKDLKDLQMVRIVKDFGVKKVDGAKSPSVPF